jgi:two-component system, response regulator PdtaR
MAEPVEGRAKVLVVDDEGLQRMWMADILEDAGFEVISAPDGERALEVLGEIHNSVRAVLTDVRMPGAVDGITLAGVVRERWPHISVVILSGFGDSATHAPRNARLLLKPINPDLLLKVVQTAAAA